jgi:hypothetical protein
MALQGAELTSLITTQMKRHVVGLNAVVVRNNKQTKAIVLDVLPQPWDITFAEVLGNVHGQFLSVWVCDQCNQGWTHSPTSRL